ncbi:MAG: hypothetical protein K6B40_08410 [Firmicutes bacterium]|nr:hypothetical protein [Bacillota bacterium]
MGKKWQEVAIDEQQDGAFSIPFPGGESGKYTDEQGQALTDTGYLCVQTHTARKTYPVQNALVTLKRKFAGGEELLQTYYTDSFGQTPLISLPTLDRAQSMNPANLQPYMIYSVSVVHPDYQEMRNVDVNVFGGVVSLQQFDMLPNALREGNVDIG